MISNWEQKWYYKNNEIEINGPVSLLDLRKKFRSSEISWDTFIKNETSLPQWTQIRYVPNIIQYLQPRGDFREVKAVEEPVKRTRKVKKEEKRRKKVKKRIQVDILTEAERGMQYGYEEDVDVRVENRWMPGRIVSYDQRSCKYKVQISEEKRRGKGSRRQLPVYYHVFVNYLRPPVLVTKDRAIEALREAADNLPVTTTSTIRHLVHVAQKIGVDLNKLPHPASLHVCKVLITGELTAENLEITLARDDIVWDIKAEICRRIQIIPVYQKLTLDGEQSHVELDDFSTLGETGFQPNGRYMIRLSCNSNLPINQPQSVRQHHELVSQVDRTKRKLVGIQKRIAKLAQEHRYNQMMSLLQEEKTVTKDIAHLQKRVDAVFLVVKQHENTIIEQVEITRRELRDLEEQYAHLKNQLRKMLERDEIPGVDGKVPNLYRIWERLRVARMNMKLLESATEAKE